MTAEIRKFYESLTINWWFSVSFRIQEFSTIINSFFQGHVSVKRSDQNWPTLFLRLPRFPTDYRRSVLLMNWYCIHQQHKATLTLGDRFFSTAIQASKERVELEHDSCESLLVHKVSVVVFRKAWVVCTKELFLRIFFNYIIPSMIMS